MIKKVEDTKVVNIMTDRFDVYIGRPTKWGNPFRVGKDGNRKEVIEKFYWYLKDSEYLLNRIPLLVGKSLGCYCKPKPCHGDAIIRVMRELEVIDFFNNSKN